MQKFAGCSEKIVCHSRSLIRHRTDAWSAEFWESDGINDSLYFLNNLGHQQDHESRSWMSVYKCNFIEV